MVILGRCCFVVPLKNAVALVGIISMCLSLTGILVTSSTVLGLYSSPKDPLIRWLLQVLYYLGIPGIVLHTILFIVSTLLTYGVFASVPPLLVPWLIWSPLLIISILVQMVIVIIKEPAHAMPVVAFGLMVLLFIIYGGLVVVSYYKSVTLGSSTVQLRIFNIRDGELPRIVEVPQRLLACFGRKGAPRPPPPTDSVRPLQQDPSGSSEVNSAEKWPKLSSAYARLLAAKRHTAASQQENPPPPTLPDQTWF